MTSLEGLPAVKIPPKAHVPKIEPVYMQEQLGGRRGLMFGRNDDIISAFNRFEFRAYYFELMIDHRRKSIISLKYNKQYFFDFIHILFSAVQQ